MLPGPAGRLVLQPVTGSTPDAQRVDQRVALVAGVEDDLAADVGQAEAVAVAADAGDHAGQHPGGVRVVGGAEPQRVHHRDRPGAHRQDVADDPADAGGRALVGLHEGRVVVRLDLEGDRELVGDPTTPAFSPMPASSRSLGGAFSPNCRKWTLLDLYEQCSLHMIEYIASSDWVGRRPRISRIRAYSSSVRPSSRTAAGRRGWRRPSSTCRTGRQSRCGHAATPAAGRSGEVLEDRGEEAEAVGGRPGQRVDRVLRVRHHADHVAASLHDRRRCRAASRSGCRRRTGRPPGPRPPTRPGCARRRRSAPRRS